MSYLPPRRQTTTGQFVWRVRAGLLVIFIATLFWQFLESGVPVLPFIELTRLEHYQAYWFMLMAVTVALYLLDVVFNLKWAGRSEGGLKIEYVYTRLSLMADVLFVFLILFQVFFSPILKVTSG